ncbi:sigma-70 family RNA polymerase sigma factor [Sulfurovum sp. NBC37-1]|uniref:sigma-70 family RNA polymerase sigma factor n=1 Tax=Sulfurovum sp. (strain NBC37-1) TaxID=387093 RepID=UPI0001587CF2|nr:sigma-70 family RNA polymerase sigma factor [Sulfurovum sp. NBC37-1]BAF73154.1 hypothetical protein SUN_2214 [Sulfurovum sp. NBC37-1]
MGTMEIGIIAALVLIVFYLLTVNSKLKKEKKVLQEILEVKDTTIQNLQASRVAVKDVIENLSAHDEVMALLEEGKSREEIADELGIPISKIELIIKFDKIKKDHAV